MPNKRIKMFYSVGSNYTVINALNRTNIIKPSQIFILNNCVQHLKAYILGSISKA